MLKKRVCATRDVLVFPYICMEEHWFFVRQNERGREKKVNVEWLNERNAKIKIQTQDNEIVFK